VPFHLQKNDISGELADNPRQFAPLGDPETWIRECKVAVALQELCYELLKPEVLTPPED
jgi:hypothetical protein